MQRRVRARNQNRYRPLKPPAPQKSCRRENRRQLFLGSEGKVAERSVVAPARDATIYFNHTAIDNDVSIHAPTRGATGVTAATLHETINFNPRTRIGATDYFYFIGLGPNISTHAPARGATANLYKSEYLFALLLYLLHRPLSIISQFLLPTILFFHFLLCCRCGPAGKSLCACHSHCLERRSLLSVFSKRVLLARACVGGGSAAAEMALCLGRQKAAPALSSASRRP